MDEKIKNLYNNNKIVFFLLVPLIALYFCRNILIGLLVDNGNKIAGEAAKKSDELKSEEVAANSKADQIIADADKHAADKPAVGEDWNKK